MDNTVAIIGAGIVGICIAHELRQRNYDVDLVDGDEPARGCSFGNSGGLSEGSVVPLAMPGLLARIPGMLMDPLGPLYLRPAYLPRVLPWLLQFVLASRNTVVHNSSSYLARLHTGAIALHKRLAEQVGVPELVLQQGHLYLYRNEQSLKADAAGWRIRAQYGFTAQRLDRAGILALEPSAPEGLEVGMFLADHATIINPWRYANAIFNHYLALGGRFHHTRVGRLVPAAGGWSLVSTDGTSTLDAKQVVVAAGAWSNQLLDPLGAHIPLQGQRGYHVQFEDNPGITRTIVLAESKVFMSPMEGGLRVGGTVEIDRLDAPPSPGRAANLHRIAVMAFPALERVPYSTWMGHRPCTPDSLPRIGPVARRKGIWVAAGHGHLGLTDSAPTARMIADALAAA